MSIYGKVQMNELYALAAELDQKMLNSQSLYPVDYGSVNWEKKHVELKKIKKIRGESKKPYLKRRVKATQDFIEKLENEQPGKVTVIWPENQPFKLGKTILTPEWYDQNEIATKWNSYNCKNEAERDMNCRRYNLYGDGLGTPFAALVYLTIRPGVQESTGETKTAPVILARSGRASVRRPAPTPVRTTAPTPVRTTAPTPARTLARTPARTGKDVFDSRTPAPTPASVSRPSSLTPKLAAIDSVEKIQAEQGRLQNEDSWKRWHSKNQTKTKSWRDHPDFYKELPKEHQGGRKRRRKTKKKSKRKTKKRKRRHRKKTQKKRNR